MSKKSRRARDEAKKSIGEPPMPHEAHEKTGEAPVPQQGSPQVPAERPVVEIDSRCPGCGSQKRQKLGMLANRVEFGGKVIEWRHTRCACCGQARIVKLQSQ